MHPAHLLGPAATASTTGMLRKPATQACGQESRQSTAAV